MRKPVLFGSGLLLAAVVVGCGGSSEDAIVKEQISLMNEMSAMLEKVTDAQSMQAMQAKMDTLKKKGDDLAAKVKAWPDDKKKAMTEKYKPQIDEAGKRLTAALFAAMGKGGGLPDFKLPNTP